VRLEPDVEERLEKAAAKCGTSKSALIRLLAKSFVDQVVREDGTVTLPPNWADLLPPRATRSKTPVRYPDHSEESSRVEEKPVSSTPELDVARKAQSDAARLAGVSPGSPPSPGAGGPTARKPRRAGGTGPRSK